MIGGLPVNRELLVGGALVTDIRQVAGQEDCSRHQCGQIGTVFGVVATLTTVDDGKSQSPLQGTTVVVGRLYPEILRQHGLIGVDDIVVRRLGHQRPGQAEGHRSCGGEILICGVAAVQVPRVRDDLHGREVELRLQRPEIERVRARCLLQLRIHKATATDIRVLRVERSPLLHESVGRLA